MAKSILSSKIALFAFLVVTASCVSFSMAARAPATIADLESEPAPVDSIAPIDVIGFCKSSADSIDLKLSRSGHPAIWTFNTCTCSSLAPANSPDEIDGSEPPQPESQSASGPAVDVIVENEQV